MAIWDEWENERKGREEEERKGMTRPIDKPDDDEGFFGDIDFEISNTAILWRDNNDERWPTDLGIIDGMRILLYSHPNYQNIYNFPRPFPFSFPCYFSPFPSPDDPVFVVSVREHRDMS